MCIFKNAKVLTLSSTQLGSQGNLEKISFGEVLGWRFWSGGGAQAVQESTQLAELSLMFDSDLTFLLQSFSLEVTQRFPWFCSAECLFAQSLV